MNFREAHEAQLTYKEQVHLERRNQAIELTNRINQRVAVEQDYHSAIREAADLINTLDLLICRK